MSKDYLNLPRTHIRRQDREMKDEQWIKSFLERAAMGVLATVQAGQPFINSNLFVYDAAAHCIYLHTARVGRTAANLSQNSKSPVCFSVSAMGRLLPAEEALEFSVEYAGVTIFGTARILDDVAEEEQALRLLLEKYAPHLAYGEDYRAITPEQLKRTAVYRINIEEWSGKKKEVTPDFPGAFFYPNEPDMPWSDLK